MFRLDSEKGRNSKTDRTLNPLTLKDLLSAWLSSRDRMPATSFVLLAKPGKCMAVGRTHMPQKD